MRSNCDFSMELAFTDTYKRMANQSPALREAECLKAQFPAILTPVLDHDRLAGRVSWGAVGFSPHNGPPDCGYAYFCNEHRLIEAIEKSDIKAGQRDGVMAMLHFWRKEATQKKVEAEFTERMRKTLVRDEVVLLPCNVRPLVAIPLYRMAGVFLDYEKLLRLGLPGLRAEVGMRRGRAAEEGESTSIYTGMLTAIDIAIDVCRFYRDQSLAQAERMKGTARSLELHTLAQVLDSLTLIAPQSFQQALQLTWIYTLLSGALEFGRIDSYLGPFFTRDIACGSLSESEATILIHSLWALINDQIRAVDGRIIIGGKGRASEAEADQFALFLIRCARSYGKSVLPQLTLRFYEGMKPALMQEALSMIADGYTYPLLYNDDVLAPSVAKAYDVPIEAAEQYVPLGCGEIVLDHMGFGTPSGALNVLKALEITLHDGMDPITGRQLGPHTGTLERFETFEDMWIAFQEQLVHFIEILAEHEDLEYQVTGKVAPFHYLSLLYDDCLQRGKGIFSGGVRYHGGTLETYGNVTTADSLTAIKLAVFEDKLLSLPQLVHALDHNFDGFDQIRSVLCDKPKYGNDDACADEMMLQLHEFLCNTIRNQRTRTGLDWYLNVIINNSQNTTLGRWVGASADGRKAGAPMANANTPSGGNDRNGITALINSIVKPDPSIHAGAVQNFRFGTDFTTQHRFRLDGVLRSYFAKGGSQAMVTVIARGDLERALAEPEKYQDLIVRVGGFSARYIELAKDVQLEILSRTTY